VLALRAETLTHTHPFAGASTALYYGAAPGIRTTQYKEKLFN
jgi:hypothetical protein